MGLVAAMAALSLVYGNWSDNLNINGSVETGEIEVALNKFSQLDNETVKDVGQCSATPADNTTKIVGTITNGYPGYRCEIETDIENKGKIPVSIQVGDLVLTHTGGPLTKPGPAVTADTTECPDRKQIPGAGDEICDIVFEVTKASEQGQTFTFELPICAYLSDNLVKDGFEQKHKCFPEP
jgi:hypothetical protein